MLFSLDQFVFGMDTLNFHELQRQTQWKHRNTSRVGARDARQFTGPGDDTITITGLLIPEQTGALSALLDLRKMADAGGAYALVDGAGTVYGAFLIESMNEGQTLHDRQGVPQRVEFTLSLTRTDDDKVVSMSSAAGPIGDVADGSDFAGYA
ncbi:phage tail protein [Massilia sp. YIM B02763]|uniref:phage tail protein n=1 Tax=Massilia sp. YIM B02763 TaxID=3050130 RepID=UPI0025B724F0|nr:phage tail protein [Massilia sp. YIM B02763]MDN4056352.1 phage tail protein [Massilia sp. YIM B02763]